MATPQAVLRHMESWGDRIALGGIPQIIQFNKFGRNAAVGTSEEDIWFGGTFTFLETGTTLFASCSDNTNGQGQIILVSGLDENFDLKTEYVTLTGTTPVQIGAANSWVHVLRAFQVGPSFADPQGDVYIAAAGATYTTPGIPDEINLIQGYIDYTDAAQQTEQCFGIVPRGHKVLIEQIGGDMYNVSSGSARSCAIGLEVSEPVRGSNLDAAPTAYSPFRRIGEVHVSNNAPNETQPYPLPLVLDQYTRVSMRGKATATSAILARITAVIVPWDYPDGGNFREGAEFETGN